MIIIANKPGQLANRLIVFASFIAFANEFGLNVKNPAFHDYSHYFESTKNKGNCFPLPDKKSFKLLSENAIYNLNYYFARLVIRLKLSNNLFKFSELDWGQNCVLDKETVSKFAAKYCFVQGWAYRSPQLIQKHRQLVLDYFKPVEQLSQQINSFEQKVAKVNSMLIGVHIRRGDYKRFENGKYYYSDQQYLAFMKHVSSLFGNSKIQFFIVSNEKINLNFFSREINSVVTGPDHELMDMYMLSRCNYIIGPPSTYSIWASFYGNVPLYLIHDPETQFKKEDFKIYDTF